MTFLRQSLLFALLAFFASLASAQSVYNQFGPANGVLKGATTSPLTSSAASADIAGLWIDASCVGTVALLLNGHCAAAGASGANPTATATNTAVNGAATTFMRSDGAPACCGAVAVTASNIPSNGIYLPSANTLGFAINSAANGQMDSTGLSAPTHIVTSSSIPSGNKAGIYASAAGVLGIFAESANIATFDTTTGVVFATPTTSMIINGGANVYAARVKGVATASQSTGLLITAGTNTNDTALNVANAANSLNLLEVIGNGAIQMPQLASSSAGTTGTVCWTTGTGNLTVDTTTTCLASTIRVKQQVHSLPSGLSTVMRLRPVAYHLRPRFNPAHLGEQLGLIAEEVNQVEPRLVSLDDAGEPRAVRYQQLTAVLIRAIQEQQREIVELQKRIH